MADFIMVQGASANAGKSIITGGLCRLLSDAGLRVAPFKPVLLLQDEVVVSGVVTDSRFNYALLAARVQAAERLHPLVLRAPRRDVFGRILSPGVLSLPTGAEHSVPLLGEDAVAYFDLPAALRDEMHRCIEACVEQLDAEFDVVVVEGAGSPVDMGDEDIANTAVSRHVALRTLLVAKVSSGGARAGIVGTHAALSPDARRSVCGFILNDVLHGLGWVERLGAEIAQTIGVPLAGAIPNVWSVKEWSSTEEEIGILADLMRERLALNLIHPSLA